MNKIDIKKMKKGELQALAEHLLQQLEATEQDIDNNDGKPWRKKFKRRTKTGSVNKFETMPEFTESKSDVEIDKKLWHGRKPTPRRGKAHLIKIPCHDCNTIYEVKPDQITRDRDGDSFYRCNKCLQKLTSSMRGNA